MNRSSENPVLIRQIILHTPVERAEPEQDLTYRAAKLLLPRMQAAHGVEIWLDKGFQPEADGRRALMQPRF